MNIVIPMAGLGARFSKSGFLLPKPLIPIAEKPMYRYAVDCLPLKLAGRVIFIILESDFSKKIEQDIYTNYHHLSDCIVVTIKKETQGQAETILLASQYLEKTKPTLIHNCDTYIKEDFEWSTLLNKDLDGAIVLFSSIENRWSYAKLDETKKYVVDFQEKNVISNHASTGTYFFQDTHNLLETIQHNIRENIRENNEFYLSTVYQSMLRKNKKIIPLWTKNMMCFGTPQDLVDSLNNLLLHQRVKA